MVRFRGAREKDAIAFVECLGVSQEDTIEGPLWRETLGKNLGSHDATELVGGMCHGNGCRQETTRLHHWLDLFAKVKSSLLLKIHGPPERELADKTAD